MITVHMVVNVSDHKAFFRRLVQITVRTYMCVWNILIVSVSWQ